MSLYHTAHLPNVRKMFIPDTGYLMGDADLDRADLQVVVWEANDQDLKDKLRAGIDLHTENAKDLYHSQTINPLQRALAKVFVHATNYGASEYAISKSCGITQQEAKILQARWFAAHPGIREWQHRVQHSLETTRSVSNMFGFRRFYFDRIESVLPEALAWIPQSTVANVINQGIVNLDTSLPSVEILLQVHDSVVFQYPVGLDPHIRPVIEENLLIEIPYDEPLTIPVGLKLSDKSWGDCKDVEWRIAA